jgi:hypothetical protein
LKERTSTLGVDVEQKGGILFIVCAHPFRRA